MSITATPPVSALGPHEILLLVNENSPASLEVANHYANMRGIPSSNIVYLPLPDTVLEPKAEMTHKDFRRLIFDPAQARMVERGLQDHILAWVYSVDFPVRILPIGTPPISLQGATFMGKQHLPPAEDIKKGRYLSPLWRGPDFPDGPMAAPATLDVLKLALGEDLPIPSMMLGFTGARGMTVPEVLTTLERAAEADGSHPTGSIYFVTNANVRSTCREWQFPMVKNMLSVKGVSAVVTNDYPRNKEGLLGLMAGVENVQPARAAKSFTPGSMAEHLTSWAAAFHGANQTKCTEWLKAGAAATAGTVTEPYSIWMKFPSASFFLHYTRGCGMLESFFQSVRCPLQLLMIGDPLVTPWRADLSVQLTREATAGGDAPAFTASVLPHDARLTPSFRYHLDGRPLGALDDMAYVELNSAELADGHHTLRVVVKAGFPVAHQAFAIERFEWGGNGKKVEITGLEGEGPQVLTDSVSVIVKATKRPSRMGVLKNERVLVSARGASSRTLDIEPSALGQGPQTLRAFADYRDGERVLSPPLVFRTQAPLPLTAVTVLPKDRNRVSVVLETAGGEPIEDRYQVGWFEPWEPKPDQRPYTLVNGRIEHHRDHFGLVPEEDTPYATCIVGDRDFTGDEFSAEVKTIGGLARYNPCLVFSYRKPDDFCFFGLWGTPSAWVIGQYRRGQVTRRVVRGRPIVPGKWQTISVRQGRDDGVEGWVNGERVCTWADGRWAGRIGFMASEHFGLFRNARMGLPVDKKDSARCDGRDLYLGSADQRGTRQLAVRAGAGDTYIEQDVEAEITP